MCVLVCVCPRGKLCQCGSAERLLGEDPPVKWSSSPRWVSNSLNPTGQCLRLSFAGAPHEPGSPLLLPPLTLSTPLCLSNLPLFLPPPVSLCLSFQKSSKKLMRLGWRLSSPLSPRVFVYTGSCLRNLQTRIDVIFSCIEMIFSIKLSHFKGKSRAINDAKNLKLGGENGKRVL